MLSSSSSGPKYQRIADLSEFEMNYVNPLGRGAKTHDREITEITPGRSKSRSSSQYTEMLYYFTPNSHLSKIMIYENSSTQSPLRAILRRKMLLMVTEVVGGFCYIVTHDLEGWAELSLTNLNIQTALHRIHKYPKYYEWRGNNFFFCSGKVMFGSDLQFFMFTNVLYLIPSVIFFASVVPYMYNSYIWMVYMCYNFILYLHYLKY
jgi:hypothetical protein